LFFTIIILLTLLQKRDRTALIKISGSYLHHGGLFYKPNRLCYWIDQEIPSLWQAPKFHFRVHRTCYCTSTRTNYM